MRRTLGYQLFTFSMIYVFGHLFCQAYAQDTQSLQGLAREHYYQGRFYGEQEKYTEAIIELEKAIELYPAYADAYNALGVVYHRQQHYQKAIKYYLLAIEADPRHAKARTNLAMIYNEQKEFHKALQHLEKALETDPEYVLAQKLIDKVRPKAEEQEVKEQEQQQKATQKHSPPQAQKPSKSAQKTALSLFNKGTQLVKQGKIDAGIQAYRKGLKLDSRSADGHTLLGMAYRQKYHVTGDVAWRQREISEFRKALKYNSRYVPALLGLGEVYYEQGEISEAIQYFKKVLRYQPNHPAEDQLEAIIQQTP